MKTIALSLLALLFLLARPAFADKQLHDPGLPTSPGRHGPAQRSCETTSKPSLALSSPQDYQVFQRETRTQGVVSVAGRAEDASAVQVRVTAQEWKALPVDPKTGEFHGSLATPAGGWYQLDARLLAGGQVVAEAAVAHVGVGEIFIVAGQSNSCNYGAEKQKPASEKVATFDGSKWAIADDPQPGGGGHGGSFMPAFGDAMVDRFNVPVAVAACGIGATSVRQWLPKGSIMTNEPTTGTLVKQVEPGKWEATGEPFEGLMKRASALGPHGFRAVLWHQGESDAGQARAGYPAERQITGKQYQQFMEQLIRATREQAKWEIPWFVAQATYHSEKDPADEEFRAAQKALWDNGTALQGPDTDALGAEYRAGVHFNPRGLKAHGQLWAKKVGDWLDRTLQKETTEHR
jgi:hypothetical protein